MAEVMAESGYSEEDIFDCGICEEIVFLVVVPLLGACRVPVDALSHFMAGADEYAAEGMPEHWSGALSGKWTVKRDRLRILQKSWEAFSVECESRAHAYDALLQSQATQPRPTPVADSASNAPEAEPPPVATGDVAYAFDGLRQWNEKAWKDTLGSPPKWLEACIALRGERGKRETRWNPVLIGAALVHNGHTKPNSIRARFQTKPQLKDWLEAWKTYEADNFDTR